MIKKKLISITLIIMALSLVWNIQAATASTNQQEQTATATTTLSPTPGLGIQQTTTFGNAEIGPLFTSGDQKKIFVRIDGEINQFDGKSNEFVEKYELSEEYNNSILDVNGDGELIALKANRGFYIFNTKTKLKSTIYENSMDGYTFYSFYPNGSAFLYGVHHPTVDGDSTDLLLRGVDGDNNILSRNFSPPSDAQVYYGYDSPVPSPDGNYVAAGYLDSSGYRILVWKTDSNQVFYEIPNIPGEVYTLDISPDSKTFASGGADGIIHLWNMEDGAFIKNISGFNAPISKVEYIEKGKELSVLTENGRAYTYTFSINQLKEISESDESVHPLLAQKIEESFILESTEKDKFFPNPASLVFSPDGRRIALIQGSVQVWDVIDRYLIASFLPDTRFRFTSSAFDSSGERLAVLSEQGDVYVWNITTNKTMLHIPHQKMLANQAPFTVENASNAVNNDMADFSNQNIAFSPDGTQVAFANGMDIEVWNISMGAKLRNLSADGIIGRPEKLVYSKDGKSISSITGNDAYLVTWNIDAQKVTDQIQLSHEGETHGKTTALSSQAFITLNTASSGSWVDVWNLQTNESGQFLISNNTLFSTVFSETGTYLAAIDNSTTLYLWRLDTMQLLTYEKGFSFKSTLAINPFGTILAAAEDGKITFWDIEAITENGLSDNFVSPTLIPSAVDEFTYIQNPTETVAAIQTATPSQPTPSEEFNSESSQETTEPEMMENEESKDTILLKAQQNSGIIQSITWLNNKIYLTSTTGLYTYDTAKDAVTINFTNEEINISSIAGFSNVNYFSAGTSDKNQVQLWNHKKIEQLFSASGNSAPVISPDKKWMAYALGYSRFMIWNIASKRSQYIIPSNVPSTLPVFSSNGKYLAIAQGTGLIQIWNTTTGTVAYAMNSSKIPSSNIHFSTDGKTLICVAGGSAWIWPFTTDEPPIEIEVYAGKTLAYKTYFDHVVTAADINYKNEIIAIADDTGTIRFYTLENQELYKNLTQIKFAVAQLAFSPNNNHLFVVDVNGNATLWDADSSELQNELHFFNGEMSGLSTLDDGNIAAWTKNHIAVYDPSTLEIQNEIDIEAEKILDVSPNGSWAAAYSPYSVSIYDLSTGTMQTTLEPEAESISLDRYDDYRSEQAFYGAAFSPNSEYLITYGTGGAWIYQLDNNDIQKTKLLGNISSDQIHLASFSDDGNRFILSSGEGYLCPKLYETRKQTELLEFPLAEYQTNLRSGQEYSVYIISPDLKNAYLLRSDLYIDTRLEAFDLTGGAIKNFIRFEDTKADTMALSPDGSLVAVGFDTGEIHIYDAKTLNQLNTFTAHSGSVTHLTFSTDGTLLISTGAEGAVKSWIIK